MAVLGLDVGTSAVKALVLSAGGDVLAVGSAPCVVDAPRPGWAEADPQGWLAAAGDAIRQALASGAGEPIRALGLAGQMHGVVLCDAEGRPVRPALLWPDRRAAGELERWSELTPAQRARLGNPVVPGMAGPLLAWLARHEPASARAARWALQPKDWVRLRLTGEAAAEPSDASATLLWDVDADTWAADVAQAAGVDPALLAPAAAASDAPAGALRRDAAAALGLPAGIPVHAGAADAAAALLGAGVTRPGQRLLNVGTGAQLITIVEDAITAPEPVTHRFRTTGSGWYAMAAVQNAGLALRWAQDRFGVSWEQAEEEAFAAEPGGAGDPLFLPYLTGERTPLLDPHARAAWVGLALEHDRGAMLRGVYEGLAHAVRHAREALDAEAGRGAAPLRLLGGGSLRPGYRRLLADVLDEPLELLEVADASALGAALLAGGRAPEPQPVATAQPRAAHAVRLAERHGRWRAASAAMRGAGVAD